MSNINKQALRETADAANKASWGRWESYHPHKGARGHEVKVGVKAIAQHCLKVDAEFIAASNPATVLALLDELETKDKRNAELEDLLEAEIKSWMQRYDSANNRREAAEKRIAELEANKCKPVMFIDGDISPADADKLAAVIREFMVVSAGSTNWKQIKSCQSFAMP